MSVGNNTHAAFYSISNGKICRQFREPTKESKERINKNGKQVFEEFYDFIDGIITDIKTKDSDYGKFWMITLKDGDSTQVLQMQYSSGYSQAFLKMLPNVDLSSHVKIVPKLTIENDKQKSSLFITQHGSPIKWFYTKDSPNGLPELRQQKVKGKMVWDDSDIMEFLERMINTQILPKLMTESDLELTKEAEKVKDKLPF